MLSRDGKRTGLGDAFAYYGRIFKTLHLLQFVSGNGYRRLIGAQFNVTEARHRIARKIFFGQRGELHQHYREGMEDQLGALGLALNAVVLFNTVNINAAVKHLAASGFPVTDDLVARLSSLQYDHINFLGRYAFTVTRPRARARCATPTRPRRQTTGRPDHPPRHLGYSEAGVRSHLVLLGDLSSWLEGEGLAPAVLTAGQMARFLRQINALTSADFKQITLDRPGRHNKPKVAESAGVHLTSYPGTVRQLVVTGLVGCPELSGSGSIRVLPERTGNG